MTARYLLNLALALGVTGVMGCTVSVEKDDSTTGDDDDDDDDDDTGPTDSAPTGTELVSFATMTVYGDITVVGGSIDGAASFIELQIGPAEWDYQDANDDNYCLIQALLSDDSQGLLAGSNIIPPSGDVGDGSTAVSDCAEVFNVDPRIDVALVIGAIPEWAFGVAAALDGDMDPSGLPAPYDDPTGAYWNVPIIKPSLYPTVLAFGYSGSDIVPASDIHGQSTLPDGGYFSLGPVINIEGLFDY